MFMSTLVIATVVFACSTIFEQRAYQIHLGQTANQESLQLTQRKCHASLTLTDFLAALNFGLFPAVSLERLFAITTTFEF